MPTPLKKSEFIEKWLSEVHAILRPECAVAIAVLAMVESAWEDYIEAFAEAEARESKK